MLSSISPKKWESRSALLMHLSDTGGRSIILGRAAEAPRAFYSFSIPLDGSTCEVGVMSSGPGTLPRVALLQGERRALVGHDTWITWIDLNSMTIIASRRVDGVFYEFLRLDGSGDVLVVHELGVARVDAHGFEAWAVHTDIVEEAELDARGNLVITSMEAPGHVVIDVETGNVLNADEA